MTTKTKRSSRFYTVRLATESGVALTRTGVGGADADEAVVHAVRASAKELSLPEGDFVLDGPAELEADLSESQTNAIRCTVRDARRNSRHPYTDEQLYSVPTWWGKPTIAVLVRKGLIAEKATKEGHLLTDAGRKIGDTLVDQEERDHEITVLVNGLANFEEREGETLLHLVEKARDQRRSRATGKRVMGLQRIKAKAEARSKAKAGR